MFRLPTLVLMGLLVNTFAACSDPIEVYHASPARLATFETDKTAIALSDTAKSPLAHLIWRTNQVNAPLGMQIWNPDPLLKSFGIRNGDILANVSDFDLYKEFESRWRLTGQPFTEGQFNQGPHHGESEKYADFVAFLIDLGHENGRLVLNVHKRFAKIAEREANGGIYAQAPRIIHVEFGGTG